MGVGGLKNFFPPFEHQFGLKISGWGPSRGSAIVNSQHFSAFFGRPSLRGRRNLTQVSNVCKANAEVLVLDPNRLNKLPEVRFELPFHLISNSWRVFKS